jgi:protein-tyrosine phosphatase
LVVCTGNVCRSPYIERRLAAALENTEIRVSSAGTGALAGSEMDPRVAQRLRESGLGSDHFTARQLTAELAAAADLVLCASRNHRAQVVRMSPRSLRRTYALADFSDLAQRAINTGAFPSGPESFVRRATHAAEEARADVQARTNEQAEIVDPFRQSDKVFEQMFTQVDHLIPPIVALLTKSSIDRSSVTE